MIRVRASSRWCHSKLYLTWKQCFMIVGNFFNDWNNSLSQRLKLKEAASYRKMMPAECSWKFSTELSPFQLKYLKRSGWLIGKFPDYLLFHQMRELCGDFQAKCNCTMKILSASVPQRNTPNWRKWGKWIPTHQNGLLQWMATQKDKYIRFRSSHCRGTVQWLTPGQEGKWATCALSTLYDSAPNILDKPHQTIKWTLETMKLAFTVSESYLMHHKITYSRQKHKILENGIWKLPIKTTHCFWHSLPWVFLIKANGRA